MKHKWVNTVKQDLELCLNLKKKLFKKRHLSADVTRAVSILWE